MKSVRENIRRPLNDELLTVKTIIKYHLDSNITIENDINDLVWFAIHDPVETNLCKRQIYYEIQ